MLTTIIVVTNIILYIALSLSYGWGISIAYTILIVGILGIKCSPTFSVFLVLLGLCWFGKLMIILYIALIISLLLCIIDCK